MASIIMLRVQCKPTWRPMSVKPRGSGSAAIVSAIMPTPRWVPPGQRPMQDSHPPSRPCPKPPLQKPLTPRPPQNPPPCFSKSRSRASAAIDDAAVRGCHDVSLMGAAIGGEIEAAVDTVLADNVEKHEATDDDDKTASIPSDSELADQPPKRPCRRSESLLSPPCPPPPLDAIDTVDSRMLLEYMRQLWYDNMYLARAQQRYSSNTFAMMDYLLRDRMAG